MVMVITAKIAPLASDPKCCSPYSNGEAPEFGKSHAAVGQEATVEEHIHSDVSEWQD